MMNELAGVEKQINECLVSVYNKGYEKGKEDAGLTSEVEHRRGLTEAWDFAIHCMQLGFGEDTLKHYTVFEAMEKFEKQANDKIKVGDEVVNNITGNAFVIINDEIDDNGDIVGISSDYRFAQSLIAHELRKTGRSFPQIAEVLEQVKGGKE